MEQVEAIKAEREVTESELKSSTFDMKGVFLRALAQDGRIGEPEISMETLGKGLQPLQQQVTQSIERQQALILEIQVSYLLALARTKCVHSARLYTIFRTNICKMSF